jgi:hypothetical protein
MQSRAANGKSPVAYLITSFVSPVMQSSRVKESVLFVFPITIHLCYSPRGRFDQVYGSDLGNLNGNQLSQFTLT